MEFEAIYQLNCFNYVHSHYNIAFYCQRPIKSFTEISVSLAFASIFLLTIRPYVHLGVQDDKSGWSRLYNLWQASFIPIYPEMRECSNKIDNDIWNQ